MKTWPRPSTGQKSFLGFRKVLCWMATIPTTTWIRVSPCTTLTVQGKDRKAIRRVESWWHSTVPTSSTTLGCCSGTKTRGFASLHKLVELEFLNLGVTCVAKSHTNFVLVVSSIADIFVML